MADRFDRYRRPEHTGENRCWPCTITNGVALAVLVGGLTVRGRRLTAAVVAAVGTLSIALRGYVVPYTPRFAPRLVAALPLPVDPFDHGGRKASADSLADPNGATDDQSDASSGEAVLTELLKAGVVEADGDDIFLAEDVRDEWRGEIRRLREVDLETLARIADRRTHPSVDVRTRRSWGQTVLVLDSGTGAISTLPRGIAVAELAAMAALESRVESDAIRRAAGRPLRSLLEDCPLCETPLTVSRSSCCGEVTPLGETPTAKLVCPDCDERFFTFEEWER